MNKYISNFLLSLTMVLGLTLGLSPTAYASEPVAKTITWTDFSGSGSMNKDGMTLTCSARIGGNFYSGRGGFIFSPSDEEGMIKKIVITGSVREINSGWTRSSNSITWTGSSRKVNAEFQIYDVTKIEFTIEIVPHTHNFTYSADGATITATCSEEYCTLTDSKITLTIVAPEMTVSGTTKNANATLTGLEEFNHATGLAVNDFTYVGRENTTYAESTIAPTVAGKYTAKITVGKYTASIDYMIVDPLILTIDSNNEAWGTVEIEGIGSSQVSGVTVNSDGTYSVVPGTEVTIKAMPADGYYLKGWSEGAVVKNNENGTYTLMMSENDLDLVANFAPYSTLTLRSNNEDLGTVEVEGLGSEVEVVWNDMKNSGRGEYTKDGVTLIPSSDWAHYGAEFNYDGDNTFTSTLGNFTKIEIYCGTTYGFIFNDGWTVVEEMMGYKLTWTGDAKSVTICRDVYYINNITFVISKSGASGITANEDGTYSVVPGTEVTIKATPADGFHLASWSNGAEVNEDGTQKIKVTEDINIVANFSSPFAIAMDTDHKAESANSEVQNGFEINTYGYCNDNSYRLKYYLLSGEPDQYKVEFDDNRFFDVDWTELATVGPEGTIDLEIPADIPTGDYNMTVFFRNSDYTAFDSEPIEVSFHVNLPETYTVPLYDNVIALVNTCECFTDVQWYHRDNSNADWQAISGATGYYYRQVGGLTGEYFVSAKMNGVSTYTCPQTDVKTLYGAPKKVAKVHVSPNPIENNATVSIEDTENLEHSLRIINVMGNVIEVRTFNGNTTSIDMGAYPTGSYMINVDGIGVKVIRK